MKKLLLLVAFLLGGCASSSEPAYVQKITQGDRSWYSCDVYANVYGRVNFTEVDTHKEFVMYGNITIEQTSTTCQR